MLEKLQELSENKRKIQEQENLEKYQTHLKKKLIDIFWCRRVEEIKDQIKQMDRLNILRQQDKENKMEELKMEELKIEEVKNKHLLKKMFNKLFN